MHEKPYFLFPNVLKRWSFQKTFTGILSFLYHQERWYFFCLKIWSYSLDGKKNGLSQKNTRKYEIFLKCSEKRLSFQKNIKYFVLIFWCCIDTINHIAPAFTSYNSIIAPLLVNCFLKYREILLAENGLLWILNKLWSVLLKNCSEN